MRLPVSVPLMRHGSAEVAGPSQRHLRPLVEILNSVGHIVLDEFLPSSGDILTRKQAAEPADLQQAVFHYPLELFEIFPVRHNIV